MSASEPPSASNLLGFYRLVGQLKTTKRAGWVLRDVNQPESVSDHMYRMSLIALTASPSTIDKTHAVKLALIHDLAEAIVGDITPLDGIGKEEKHRLEEQAMAHIRDVNLVGSDTGKEVYQLWVEYEHGQTEAARFVKQIDKLELVLQADEYERAQAINLGEFFDSTAGAITHPCLTDIDKAVRSERNQRL